MPVVGRITASALPDGPVSDPFGVAEHLLSRNAAIRSDGIGSSVCCKGFVGVSRHPKLPL